MTPPYKGVVAGRLVTDRVARGNDLGRFSSKFSVYISRRDDYKPPSCSLYIQQKNILIDL